MELNELEILVIATKTMRFSEKESLAYLKVEGHDISLSTYYRILDRISTETLTRVYDIAKNFKEQHLRRIDSLEQIEKLLWRNVHKTNDPEKQTIILKEIRDLQPYLSAYYEATKNIMKEVVKGIEKEYINLSPLGV